MRVNTIAKMVFLVAVCGLVAMSLSVRPALGGDLDDLKKSGVLRQLGVPYAHFVVSQNQGLSIELMQRFANHLGVRHEFVQSGWGSIFQDLTGRKHLVEGDSVKEVGQAQVRGDVIACGLTKLGWREKIVDFSDPTFPTQVWVIAGSDFPEEPVKPSGDIGKDIASVKKLLTGHSLLTTPKTCLDHSLYGIDASTVKIMVFEGTVNDIAPAVLKGDADLALLDVPDCLVAFGKWPGKIKIQGPVSEEQEMAAAFRKGSPELRAEFNAFLHGLKQSGEYRILVEKHYPGVFLFFKDFLPGS